MVVILSTIICASSLIFILVEWSRESDSKVVLPQAQWKEQSREISTQWKDSYAQLIKFGKSLDKVSLDTCVIRLD